MSLHRQMELLAESSVRALPPDTGQLLKWIGNKHRFAGEIVSYFPKAYATYREPFLGSGAVLGALAPETAIGSDSFRSLIEIWQMLRNRPEALKQCYAERWHAVRRGNKVEEYERIKARYNQAPNGPDLLFLSRACYGGVVRFRKADGYMSTPCGVHDPISPASFAKRVDEWRQRTAGTTFVVQDYETTMAAACPGDLIYCDPPYTFTQSILYGAQSFDLAELFHAIRRCKNRGAFVALSIDGTKRSGSMVCQVPVPPGLFEREIMVHCGRSMLRRFQMNGKTLEKEVVHDRLLLTY
jgi:DNA adenine methylase